MTETQQAIINHQMELMASISEAGVMVGELDAVNLTPDQEAALVLYATELDVLVKDILTSVQTFLKKLG